MPAAVFIKDDDGGEVVFCVGTTPCYDTKAKGYISNQLLDTLPTVYEGGSAASYSIMLKTDPRTVSVTITVTPSPELEVSLIENDWSRPRQAAVVFTTHNFGTPQLIYFRAVNDNVRRGERYLGGIGHRASSSSRDFDEGVMNYKLLRGSGVSESSVCSSTAGNCVTGQIIDNDAGLRAEFVLDNEDGTLSLSDVDDEAEFRLNVRADICKALNIECSRVDVVELRDG